MFWRKPQKSAAAETASSLPTPAGSPPTSVAEIPDAANLQVQLDATLELAADILRARARYPFGIAHEEPAAIAMAFEQWAAHLLVRSPPPATSVSPDARLPNGQRDYRALIQFVMGHAKREQEWVQASTRDMREAILALVESFRRSSTAHGQQDDLLKRRLAGLHNAIESGSAEGLKREARAVASAVSQVMEEQRSMAEAQTKELRERLTSLGEQLEQTRKETETDPLTRVANRRLFDVAFPQSLAVAGVFGRPIALMMVDIDHFKSINDTHGHVSGDEVLRAVADALSRAFPRRSDLVVRYGGEEFAVVLNDIRESEVKMLQDRLLHAVRSLRIKLTKSEKIIAVTTSVGVAISDPSEGPADLIVRADKALYAAKHGGRNRGVIAPPPACAAPHAA